MQVAPNTQISIGQIRRIKYILFGPDMEKLARVRRKSTDWRETPVYPLTEVAHYLGIKPTTMHNWVYGRHYWTKAGRKFFDPVLAPANKKHGLLSFYNLAEAHILAATRYAHGVSLGAIRTAIDEVKKTTRSKHPLLSKEFFTDGKDLFIRTIEENTNLSTPGQLNFKEVLDLYLQRVIRDDNFKPFKVYPLVKDKPEEKVIAIVHGVSSGRPIIERKGIPVSVVWQRYRAGEKPESLADDFDISLDEVNTAINYIEHNPKAA